MKIVKDYINLLPSQEKSPFPFLKAVFVLFAAAWLVAFGLQTKRIWKRDAEIGSLTQRKQALRQEADKLQKELGPAAFGAVREKGIVRDLLAERVLWSEVFRQFSQMIPAGVWFDSLEGNKSERTEIKIRGGALNYLTLGQFMTALEKSGYFINPKLHYAQKSLIRGMDMVKYEITCETVKETR